MSYSSNPSSWNDAEPVRFSSRALRAELAENEPTENESLSALLGQHSRAAFERIARNLPLLAASHALVGTLLGVLLAMAPFSLANIGAIALILATLAIDTAMIMIARRVEQRNFSLRLANTLITGGGFAVAACFTAAIGISFAPNSPDLTGIALSMAIISVALLAPLPWTAVAALSGVFVVLSALTRDWMLASVLLLGLATSVFVALGVLRQNHLSLRQRVDLSRRSTQIEALFTEFEESESGWFWETDRFGQITYCSERLAQSFGRTAQQLESKALGTLFHTNGSEGRASEEQTVEFLLTARLAFRNIPVSAQLGDDTHWWSLSGRPVIDELGRFLGFRGHGTDLSEQQRLEAQAARQGQYDALTGLANRVLIHQTLDQAIARIGGNSTGCGLFLLDLDRFKAVNDNLGHPVGDQLLKMVAERLQIQIGERGRVGRLGGDEFMIVLPGETNRTVLAEIARDTIAVLSKKYLIKGATISIGASIGIAIAPYDGENAEALVGHSDMALYAAKSDGRGVHRFYDPQLLDAATERRQFEADLRDAVLNERLTLAFQPFVNTKSGAIIGFEALARWHHPTRGALAPEAFIPVAEQTGLINQLGEWVLLNACREAAKWPASIRVAVNVSAVQFEKGRLRSAIEFALTASGIDPKRLELDLTENLFAENRANADRMVFELKQLGIRLALDDFGTGHSSLANLKTAAFDKIKLDQSFILGAAGGHKRDAAIIRSIVGLADSLGIETLAEGIETEDDAALAELLGCTSLQGFAFGRPVPADQIAEVLAEGESRKKTGVAEARRVPRMTLFRAAMLRCDEMDYKVILRNISPEGASIECPRNFEAGTLVSLDLGVCGPIPAHVVWADEAKAGLAFDTPFDMTLVKPNQRLLRRTTD